MPKRKPHVRATEWLEGDELYRLENVPRKLSREELGKMRKDLPYSVFRAQVSRVSNARLRYEISTRSIKTKMKFIQDRLKGAPIKYDTKKAFQDAYTKARMKAHARYGYSDGYIEDVDWYIIAGNSAGIDGALLDRLKDVTDKLTFDELQQLYHDLPEIKLYYQPRNTAGQKKAYSDAVFEEWEDKLRETVEEYEEMVKKKTKKGK